MLNPLTRNFEPYDSLQGKKRPMNDFSPCSKIDSFRCKYEEDMIDNTTTCLRPENIQGYAQCGRRNFFNNDRHQINYAHQGKLQFENKDKRREIVKKWHDWKCQSCSQINSGHFYKCISCENQATLRQYPPYSWQCQNCTLGRNNWSQDHCCSCCLEPNKNIPKDQLREKSPELRPFGRSVSWKPVLPVINP